MVFSFFAFPPGKLDIVHMRNAAWFFPQLARKPNARRELLLEAGATQERTL
jgi:hypothetical protein